MEIALTLIIMLFCLVSEAFFSGSEIGVVSADRMKLRHDAANGSRGAQIALRMLETPEQLLSTTLVGTNISVVANTTLATALVISLFGEKYAWLAILLVAPLIWIFGEIVAKSVFQQRADILTPIAIFVLRAAFYLFWPILFVFGKLTRLVVGRLGGQNNPYTLREEIATMMEMSAVDGDIDPAEKRMIRRVFMFSETTAYDIMVPLIDVVAVAREATCAEARRIAVEHAHKRLPVYDGRIDKIVGTLNALDLLRQDDATPIVPFIRPALFVPASASIEALLSEFREEAGVIAVVVDEFGGTEGLVLLEDILEVIVGELEDEFDKPGDGKAWVRRLDERSFLVSGRLEIARLKKEVGVELPEGDYETVAGFLMDAAQAIPRTGAMIQHDQVTLTVERATAQAIHEVRIAW